jgi:dihydrolipoamide dehydrogenase
MQIGIIGGGPAGYSAAIRVSNKNNKIQLFEKGEIGGVCLNTGCIPTKALISSASLYDSIDSDKIKIDWEKVQRDKKLAVKKVLLGLAGLLKDKKIEIIKKQAKLKKDGSIEIDGKEYRFDKVILATGSIPMFPPFPAPEDVWYSTDALETPELPESIAIIGAGFIGLEFGYIFSSFGSKVYVVEKENEALPGEDIESASILRKSLMKKGIKFYFSSEVIEVRKENGKFEVFFKRNDREEKITSEKVLISIGRIPNTGNLPEAILYKNKMVNVNDFLETAIKNVYAIGDCIGGYLLAHSAFKEAEIAAKNILGGKIKKEGYTIPRVVYTHPEFASVGYSEEKLHSENIDYKVSKIPYASNGRAIASGQTTGYVKIFYSEDGKILGSIIVGENASELVSVLNLAMDNNLGIERLSEVVFPHPTFSEVIREVSLAATVAKNQSF